MGSLDLLISMVMVAKLIKQARSTHQPAVEVEHQMHITWHDLELTRKLKFPKTESQSHQFSQTQVLSHLTHLPELLDFSTLSQTENKGSSWRIFRNCEKKLPNSVVKTPYLPKFHIVLNSNSLYVSIFQIENLSPTLPNIHDRY